MRQILLHISLFCITLMACSLAGAEWTLAKNWFYSEQTLVLKDIITGLEFAVPLLLILTVHEFGHYLFARFYKLSVSLPYYIPMWLGFLPIGFPSLGTMGAYIRLKEAPKTTQQYFDIGVAGPLAGFCAAVMVLIIGYLNLPGPEYVLSIHPEFAQWGLDYPEHAYETPNVKLGSNLLMELLAWVFADAEKLPNGYELMHYPLLFAGYISLVFTSMNLIPIGQLDGGHVVYGLLGREKANRFMPLVLITFLFFAGIGEVNLFNLSDMDQTISALPGNLFLCGMYYLALSRAYPDLKTNLSITLSLFALQFVIQTLWLEASGLGSYLIFAVFTGRFIGVSHPPALIEHELSSGRKLLGWIAIVVFVLCFTPQPFQIVAETGQ